MSVHVAPRPSPRREPLPAEPPERQDDQAPPEQHADIVFSRLVAHEVRVQRVRAEARARLAAEHAAARLSSLPEPITLAAALELPRPAVRYRVADLLPSGGNALLNATRKTGKTTTTSNLVRSLVDGRPFLGAFDTRRVDGRVGVLNYELTEHQQTDWLDELKITRRDAVVMFNLRGQRVPLLTDPGAEWLTGRLRRAEVEVVIIDPAGRAFVSAGGVNENDNSEVLRFLARLDEIKTAAGVSELILPIHGHRGATEGAERTRGASAWEDWPDAIWNLVSDRDGARYLSALGRDVDVRESRLDYDPTTRRLTVAGGSRRDSATERQAAEAEVALPAVLTVVRDTTEPPSGRVIEELLTSAGTKQKTVREAVKLAAGRGLLTTSAGPRNATLHHLTDPGRAYLNTRSASVRRSASAVRQRTERECVSASYRDALTDEDALTASASPDALAEGVTAENQQ